MLVRFSIMYTLTFIILGSFHWVIWHVMRILYFNLLCDSIGFSLDLRTPTWFTGGYMLTVGNLGIILVAAWVKWGLLLFISQSCCVCRHGLELVFVADSPHSQVMRCVNDFCLPVMSECSQWGLLLCNNVTYQGAVFLCQFYLYSNGTP